MHHYFAAGACNVPRFIPAVTPSPFPQRALHDSAGSCVLDCRHGRVLFGIPVEGVNLVVWDPTTGKQQGLPEPPIRRQAYNAAVLCAVCGCDHLDCHSGPFFVVLVGYGNGAMGSHFYSSEAGAWNASADLGSCYLARKRPSALLGDDIYFVVAPSERILKYNLGMNCLSIIHPPEAQDNHGDMFLVPMEDGSLLGLARLLCSRLYLWSRNADPKVVAGWVQFRDIDLLTLIPFRRSVHVVGSTEGFGIIFVGTDDGVFAMELKSGDVRKVGEHWEHLTIFPFMSFFTPGDQTWTMLLGEVCFRELPYSAITSSAQTTRRASSDSANSQARGLVPPTMLSISPTSASTCATRRTFGGLSSSHARGLGATRRSAYLQRLV
ncbi:hypothetical protein C2845_PM18G06010 [Panicum miliaceum]|uniref:F-box protein AT5G49610-like beta-propeller domain-containing protein n=1 Tax=Panicum miliaceum TaxID=4540 RepID=A0A3L6PKX6_PANMI|nr:hypothetical protein C2845_PM18G06010 [Panicum miliaceum]